MRFVAALFLGASFACGQKFRATLSGRVLDPTHAPVGGDAFTLVHVDIRGTFAAKSTPGREYTCTLVRPGKEVCGE